VGVVGLVMSCRGGRGRSTATIAPASGVPNSSVTIPVTKASAGAASTARPPDAEVENRLDVNDPSKQPAIKTLIAFFISCPPFSNNRRLIEPDLTPSAGVSLFFQALTLER